MICSGRDDRIEKIETFPLQPKTGLEWATRALAEVAGYGGRS